MFNKIKKIVLVSKTHAILEPTTTSFYYNIIFIIFININIIFVLIEINRVPV